MKNKANIAKERVEILLGQAEEAVKNNDLKLAKRYVSLARKIAMKVQLSIPRQLKRKFCKKCNSYWVPAKTVRVRSQKNKKTVTFTCLICGEIQRFPYSKKKGKL